MDGLAKEYLISFYDRSLLLHGDRPEAVRWTGEGQRRQYALMLGLAGDLNGKRLLDYGCGKGDLYGYLRGLGLHADYTGFDINPSLIKLAREKYPNCKFRVFDIEEEDLYEDYDYIFLCGVFNTRVEGVTDSFKKVLRHLFAHDREGLVFTALSSHVRDKDFELNYTDPDEMLRFALGLAPYAALRHDGEVFALCLYKKPITRHTEEAL